MDKLLLEIEHKEKELARYQSYIDGAQYEKLLGEKANQIASLSGRENIVRIEIEQLKSIKAMIEDASMFFEQTKSEIIKREAKMSGMIVGVFALAMGIAVATGAASVALAAIITLSASAIIVPLLALHGVLDYKTQTKERKELVKNTDLKKTEEEINSTENERKEMLKKQSALKAEVEIIKAEQQTQKDIAGFLARDISGLKEKRANMLENAFANELVQQEVNVMWDQRERDKIKLKKPVITYPKKMKLEKILEKK